MKHANYGSKQRQMFFAAALCSMGFISFSRAESDAPKTAKPEAPQDALVALSDEFSSADSLTKWTNRDEAENTGPSYEKLDIGKSRAGHLTILPRNTYWYQEHSGAMLYKTVTGDFIAATYVTARNRDNLNIAPMRGFNSAGLIARNPDSADGPGNWVILNVGMQQNAVGTETKTTRNNSSQLFLDNGEPEGELRLCRIGDTFYFFRKLRNETDWRLLRTVARPDLPSTLQVGIMCNGYQAPADLHAEFDYVRFATPKNLEDCTRTLEATS